MRESRCLIVFPTSREASGLAYTAEEKIPVKQRRNIKKQI